MGRVEILISLDALDPPAGRLRVMPGPVTEELRFSGWLGLLRALYDVTGADAAARDLEES
jgi:hypothetical protein